MDSIKVFITIFTALSSQFVHAQIAIERQVIGSTGSTADHAGTIYQYTVGEAAITTLIQQPILLTQGFQQPEVTVLHDVPQIPYVTDFILFPNPAVNYTTIRFTLLMPGKVSIMLVNNAGQIVFSEDWNAAEGQLEYKLPLQRYASGFYYLVLSVDSSRKYTEKLIIQ